MTPAEALASLESNFSVSKKIEFRGETTLVMERGAIHAIANFCKEELGFDYLVDVSGVDHFGEEPRFEVVYELYSMARGQHLRLKIAVSEDDLEVPTVSDVVAGSWITTSPAKPSHWTIVLTSPRTLRGTAGSSAI